MSVKGENPGQRAHRAGVRACWAALAFFCLYLALHKFFPDWSFVAQFLMLAAAFRMCGQFGWEAGWTAGRKARGADVAEQMRDRVASEYLAGAPASMVAVYASIEAEHIIAGHTCELADCEPCNTAGTEWVRERWRDRKVPAGETQEA